MTNATRFAFTKVFVTDLDAQASSTSPCSN